MAPDGLEVPEDSTVKSGELNHMMLLLEQHVRYIYARVKGIHQERQIIYDGKGLGFFYWKEKDKRPEKMKKSKNKSSAPGHCCKTCGTHFPEPKVSGPYKSFLACLYDAVAPWHGENG